jgi:hypothetical protein
LGTKLFHDGVAISKPNAEAWPALNSQKAKSQPDCVNRPPDTFGICHPTQPGFVLSPPAEKFTARQKSESEWNPGGAKYRESFLTFFY